MKINTNVESYLQPGRLGNRLSSIKKAIILYLACKCPTLTVPGFMYKDVSFRTLNFQQNETGIHLICNNHTIDMKKIFYYVIPKVCIVSKEHKRQAEIIIYKSLNIQQLKNKSCNHIPYDTAWHIRSGDIFNGRFQNGVYIPRKVHKGYYQPSLSFYVNCTKQSKHLLIILEDNLLTGNPIGLALKSISKLGFFDVFTGSLRKSLFYLQCIKRVCAAHGTFKNAYYNPLINQTIISPIKKKERWFNNDLQRYKLLTR